MSVQTVRLTWNLFFATGLLLSRPGHPTSHRFILIPTPAHVLPRGILCDIGVQVDCYEYTLELDSDPEFPIYSGLSQIRMDDC